MVGLYDACNQAVLRLHLVLMAYQSEGKFIKFFANGKKCVERKEKMSIFAAANRKIKGSLAQLVQSTCLTSRGSLVRIQQFPR